jgi:sugar transferase (PEP-CTERM/EpsH1 system associated)
VQAVRVPTVERGNQSTISPSRRKILFLCYRFPFPLIGGDRLKSYHLLQHLSKTHDVDLIALDEWNTGSGDALAHIESFLHKVTVVPFNKVKAGVQIVASLPTRNPIEMAWYHSGEMQDKVDEALRTTKYDVIMSFFMRTAPYVRNVHDTPKIMIAEDSRLLADERASNTFAMTAEYIVRKIDAAKLRHFEPQIMKQFTVTTFVARPDERRVKAVDPGIRTAMLTNGVDLNYFEYKDSGREDAMLFAGNLPIFHNAKMAERILRDIFPKIRAERPEMKFWIVGKDPENWLQKLIEKTEGAELFANVSDMRPFYQKAKLFIHPQDVGAGIQNKLLEAMASGCPVVTTPIGASGIDGIINGMHVMVSETDEEFVQTALRLLDDDKERHWLAHNSRQLIEKRYQWQNVFSSLDDIIEGIIPDFFSITTPKHEQIT